MPDLNLKLEIKVAPGRVFKSLVDNETVSKYFAEHCDISPTDNRYDFWGANTPGTPDRSSGKHELISYEPGKMFSYRWHLRGNDTIVRFEVSPFDGGSLLVLRHFNLPKLEPFQSSIGDFWSHVIENLKSYLERGVLYPKMVYKNIPKGDVTVSADIDGTPEVVYDALINPEKLNRYIARDAKVDPKVGGKYDFGWGEGGPVKILDLQVGKKLSYSWQYSGEPDTVTTWTLEGSGGKTRLTVVQSGFDKMRNSEDYYIGWFKFVFRIKSLIEIGFEWKRTEPAEPLPEGSMTE